MSDTPMKSQLIEDMYTERHDQAGQVPEETIRSQLLEDIAEITSGVLDLEDKHYK